MNIMINLDYHRIVYSIEAQMELDSIEDYLYSEMQFSREYAHNYVEDMKSGFEKSMLISSPSHYNDHKRHGKYVASYRRNPRTRWYALYDIIFRNTNLINHIMNNHTTVKGI